VVTARAKGLTDNQVLYGHVFRNAMLIVIAGFPAAFISAFFTGSLLIETIFSLDGLGRLGFESIVRRDYPVVFATLYIFSLMGLLVGLLSDLVYTWVDPAHRLRAEGCLMNVTQPIPPAETHQPVPPPLPGAEPIVRTRRPWLSPINRRRWQNFKANRRGYWSLWMFLVLFVLALFAEFIANDRPLVASYKGETAVSRGRRLSGREIRRLPGADRLPRPLHPGRDRGQWLDDLAADPLFLPHGESPTSPIPPPTPPWWLMDEETRCSGYALGADDPLHARQHELARHRRPGARRAGPHHLRLPHLRPVRPDPHRRFGNHRGRRPGAIQGYFGGWTDLLIQRFIEIWSSMPVLYILLIIAAILPPGFFVLLGIMLLFSWVALRRRRACRIPARA
jgi:hypothetical protein